MTDNIAAIFFDLGDTIMDEGTEIKDASGTTQSAELIQGMADALRWLHGQGFRLALVADSRPNTPRNVLDQHGLSDLFECFAVSELVGVEKPHEGMFLHALQTMGIAPADYSRVLMVGNNLERDMVGANRLGLRSVFFHVNDRRRTAAQAQDEIPRYTVASASELLDLVNALAVDTSGERVPDRCGKIDEVDWVGRFAPCIWFDQAEPFFPQAVGYTIFRSEEQSPSFPRRITRDWRPDWLTAIEYAIWWDWDIGHLYELEHVWVYLDGNDQPVWVEASSHGAYASMIREDQTIPLDGTHPVVYSQPGKHAFSPVSHWFTMFRDVVFAETSMRAGLDGVLVKGQYAQQIHKTPENDRCVAAWLKQRAFMPAMQFNQLFRVGPELLIPWPTLDAWIPQRVNWWIDQLCP